MRTKLTVVAVVVLLCAAVVAAQRATFTPIAGGASFSAPPYGGTVRCIGGEPTGAPWPPCSPGSKVQVRGLVLTYSQVARKPDGSVDPLFTGTRTLIFNYEHVAEGHEARVWGTFRLVLDDNDGNGESDGMWEGTFSGALAGQVVGHGTEGEVEGMLVLGTYSYDHFPGPETFSGYVLDPKGKE